MGLSRDRVASVTLFLVACLAAGCTNIGGPASPSSSPTPPNSAFVVDWDARNPTELPGGWQVSRCIPQLVCVSRGSDPVTINFAVSANHLPARFVDIAETDGDAAALEGLVRLFIREQTEQQRGSCVNYQVSPDQPTQLMAADGLVIRSGYTGRLAGGPTDMVTVYTGLRDNALVSLSGYASDPGACAVGGESVTPAQLASFVLILDQVIIASGLPRSDS